tara:strand:+ start:699 stop:1046 length:348 start_codon:yes stop_codon:yes gene_type:complete
MKKTRSEEMREQAERFHKQHPEIWDQFVRFTRQIISRGFANYSVNAVFHRVRWEQDMGGDGTTQFKINNNYAPYYSRRFMKMYPQHDGFFRTRKLTSEEKPATHLPELGPDYFDG